MLKVNILNETTRLSSSSQTQLNIKDNTRDASLIS